MNQGYAQHASLDFVLQYHPGDIVVEPNVMNQNRGLVVNDKQHRDSQDAVFLQE
jgi:hypothetical protein